MNLKVPGDVCCTRSTELVHGDFHEREIAGSGEFAANVGKMRNR